MNRFENFISGSLFFGAGVLILCYWRYLVQSAIDSDNAVWPKLGIPQAPERIRRIGGEIIAKFVGVMFILAGSLMLYSAFTGRDWPLHYASWKDLWPF